MNIKSNMLYAVRVTPRLDDDALFHPVWKNSCLTIDKKRINVNDEKFATVALFAPRYGKGESFEDAVRLAASIFDLGDSRVFIFCSGYAGTLGYSTILEVSKILKNGREVILSNFINKQKTRSIRI